MTLGNSLFLATTCKIVSSLHAFPISPSYASIASPKYRRLFTRCFPFKFPWATLSFLYVFNFHYVNPKLSSTVFSDNGIFSTSMSESEVAFEHGQLSLNSDAIWVYAEKPHAGYVVVFNFHSSFVRKEWDSRF